MRDPRRVGRHLQLFDVRNVRFELMRKCVRRSRRLQIRQQLHQFAIHHRIARRILAQQLLRQASALRRARSCRAPARAAQRATNRENSRRSSRRDFLSWLLHLAAHHRFATRENLLQRLPSTDSATNSPVAPCRNCRRMSPPTALGSCQSLAGIFSSARRAANATNRSVIAQQADRAPAPALLSPRWATASHATRRTHGIAVAQQCRQRVAQLAVRAVADQPRHARPHRRIFVACAIGQQRRRWRRAEIRQQLDCPQPVLAAIRLSVKNPLQLSLPAIAQVSLNRRDSHRAQSLCNCGWSAPAEFLGRS